MLTLAVHALALAAPAKKTDGLYGPDSPVLSPTAREHDDLIMTGAFVLVEYYASWCGHCQQFAPKYEDFARAAAAAVPTLKVAAMNCVSHDELCKDRHVKSFPTIYLYP